MLFAVDVGNTNITCGIFNGEILEATIRLTTKIPRTSDEYGIFLLDALSAKGIKKEQMEAVIISSVVPQVMYSLNSAFIKYFDITPMIVGAGMKTGIRINTANPREIGADRIADAVGAYELYGGPVIVIDFGTATTYDLVSGDATFLARITSPGIRIAANALWNDTAKLPEVEIKKPETILARDTITSMQAGLVYGCIGQTEYIIKRIKEESGLTEAIAVATGGLGKIISDATDQIKIYDSELTLKGLRLIYEKQ